MELNINFPSVSLLEINNDIAVRTKKIRCASEKQTNWRILHFSETLEERLPPKQSSDRRETLRKRVSHDPRHFNVWRNKFSST